MQHIMTIAAIDVNAMLCIDENKKRQGKSIEDLPVAKDGHAFNLVAELRSSTTTVAVILLKGV